MRNRAAKLGSALIASFIASASFISMSYGETPAADECLSAPKDDTPAGSHWYYRVEHPSNRHCWYVRGANATVAKTEASAPPALTKPSPNVATSAEMPGSVANAHAELAEPRTRLDRGTGAASGQFPAAMPNTDSSAPAANSQAAISQDPISQDSISHAVTPQVLTPADAAIPGSVVASRWPDQMAANTPTTSSQVATAPESPPDANDVVADATPSAQSPGKNNVRVAVADTVTETPLEKPRASTQMMFIVMIGAFSVAGLVASAVGLGGRRRKRARLVQARRSANWDAARPTRQRPSRFPSPLPSRPVSPSIAIAAQRPNIGLPLELREPEELQWPEVAQVREPERHEAHQHDAKVVDMLSRLARSAQV
jgi:hypothetical protein